MCTDIQSDSRLVPRLDYSNVKEPAFLFSRTLRFASGVNMTGLQPFSILAGGLSIQAKD